MNIEIYKYWGRTLTEAIEKAYRKGAKSIVDLNKKKILGFDERKLFEIEYNDVDRELLRNFTVEAFTVAGVMSYELEEKLKNLATDLMKSGELKKFWVDEAYNIIAQYVPVEIKNVPPPNYLQTNIQTAVNSAYHGARWQRLEQLQDVYPYLQYKTQDDEAVRDEHRLLHDKVFKVNDPIWDTIYPPNGWNCRCYTTPMTIDEVSSSGIEPENIADENGRKQFIKMAGISPEFNRNSGKMKSIYDKWLRYNATDKMMKAINRQLIDYVTSGNYKEDEELWAEKKAGKTVMRKIRHTETGIEIEIYNTDKTTTKKDSYKNINSYRKGILIIN